MATTTFSGPVISDNSFVVQSETAANIADSSAAINTANKVAGKMVFDSTNSKLYVAAGSGATADWINSDNAGTGDVTPS